MVGAENNVRRLPLRECEKCHLSKRKDDFSLNRRNVDGINKWCVDCSTANAARKRDHYKVNPESGRGAAIRWRLKNLDRVTSSNLTRHYGIGIAEYDRLFEKQSGQCAICKTDKPYSGGERGGRLHVDHCHSTGKVRGLLCSSCNVGLGRFKDSAVLIRTAADYLEKNEDRQ